jgi:hypothetical protein
VKRLSTVLILLFSLSSFALEFEFLNQIVIPTKQVFHKTKIGGLSGLVFDSNTQKLFAISDDRGLVDEPRIYQFTLEATLKTFKVEPEKVIFLTVNESEMSHKTTGSSAKLFAKVLDPEAISMTPWGDFLVTNEGDMNKRPRTNPQIFTVNAGGTIMREYEVPKDFLPEASGAQKSGVLNNMAFEGLAASPNGKEWMVATEAPLMQDPTDSVRFVRYDMPEAWVLKPAKEYKYPLAEKQMNIQTGLELQKGVSEVHYLNDHELLVLERLVQISKQGMDLKVQLYRTDLKQADSKGKLTKSLVLDFGTFEPKIGRIANFEGMTWGPTLSDGRRTLIFVSDDNFMKSLRTQFLLFAVKTP